MFSSSALSVASSTPWVTVASAVTFGLVGFPAGRPAALTADTGGFSVAVGAAAAAGWSPLAVAARCARVGSALALVAGGISLGAFCCSSIGGLLPPFLIGGSLLVFLFAFWAGFASY